MTAKEYLNRVTEMNRQIDCKIRELEHWRDISQRISGSRFEEKYNPNHPTEAPFASCIGKIDELERKISAMTDELSDTKDQIRHMLESMKDWREHAVLEYRYLDGLSWQEIESLLYVSRATVHRIHGSALSNFPVPGEN